jgi:hypothetical protein
MISLPEVPVFSFATYGGGFPFPLPDVDASAPLVVAWISVV